jgi:hypothetical protein
MERLRRNCDVTILIHAFVSRVYDQVIIAYQNGESDRATSMLKVLDELTAAPQFPKGFLTKIATSVRIYVLQSVNPKQLWAAEQMLDVLDKLPLFEEILGDYFHGAAAMIGACVREDVKRGQWFEAVPMLKVGLKLPLSMTILGSIFAEITTEAQPCIDQACNSKDFSKLLPILTILKQLPSSTKMLSDLFAGVVETVQAWIIAAQDTMNCFEVYMILHVSREMPDSFYLQVAATARACVASALTRGQMFFAEEVIQYLCIEEGSVRRLPEDFFIEVAVAAGGLVLQAFKNKQFREVREIIPDALERLWLPQCMELTAHPYLEAFRTAAACIAQALRDGQFSDVDLIFRIINQLNKYERLPADLFVEVHTTAEECVTQALRDGRFLYAISTLDVLPAQLHWVEYPAVIAIAARDCVVQALKSRPIAEDATDICVFLKKMLPPNDPSNLILEIATTSQACIVQALHNNQFSEARSIVEILHQLPEWLNFGPHIFVETATMLGKCVIEAITDKRLEDAKLLFESLYLLRYTDGKSSVMGNVMDVAQACVVQALDHKQLSDASRVSRFVRLVHRNSVRGEKCHVCGKYVSQLDPDKPERCIAEIMLSYFDIAYPHCEGVLVKDTYRKFRLEYPRKLYEDWGERKFDDGSGWRKEYVSYVKASPIFHDDITERYNEWVHMHEHALYTLESIFRRKLGYSEEIDVCVVFIRLWPFLPSGLSRQGMSLEEQKYLVDRMNKSSNTNKEQFILMNNALDELCSRVDPDTLQMRTNLENFPALVTRQQYQGLQVILFKRLLLQTPLIFWPAIFEPGISQLVDEPPSTARILGSQNDPYVACVNTHNDRGYETLFLWEQIVHSRRISFQPEDVDNGSTCYLTFPGRPDK